MKRRGSITIYKQAEQEYEKLKKKIKQLNRLLSRMPEGKLTCAKNGTRYKWYQTFGENRKYIPKNSQSLAQKLAYKSFLSIQIQNLTQEKNALEFYLRHHPQKSWNEIITQKSKEYRRLLSAEIETINLPVETHQSIQEWVNESYEQSKKYPEQLTCPTIDGKMVRSKSEGLICTFLHIHKIPYRYESPLEFDGVTYYPDFTIMHPVTSQIYYWEHFGMMDDKKYLNSFYTKMEWYISHGIIPGINLIMTCETSKKPIDSKQIEGLIGVYFERGEQDMEHLHKKFR